MARCSHPLNVLLLAAALPVFVLGLTGCPPEDNPRTPEANFSATPHEGVLPLDVQFNDMSLPGTSQIRVWFWEFGDGTFSRDPNPRHEYTAPGVYTVKLTVESAEGLDVIERVNFITVIERDDFAFIDGDGGTVGLGGVSVEVPAGAFDRPTSVGVIYEEEPFHASFPEEIVTVSPAYTIAHGNPVSDIYSADSTTGVITPTRIEMAFLPDLVPAADRNGRKIHLVATLPSGESIPVFGTVNGNHIVASVTGLPPRATYGVVYRPDSQQVTVTVDAGKAATGLSWATDWVLQLSPRLSRELTALRLGTLQNPAPYNRLDFTAEEVDQTNVVLAAKISRIVRDYQEAGLRSPLLTEIDGAYPVSFYEFASGYNPNFEDVRDVLPFTTVFGSVAIDPAQLLNITRHNVARVMEDANLDQEFAFAQAFGQAVYEASFDGYGLPGIAADNPSQNENDVPFYEALRGGAGLYFGQLQGDLPFARSFGPNEVASLTEKLFAPFSEAVPGYGLAGQDFLFFLQNSFAIDLTSVFMSIDPTKLGLLERLRLALTGETGLNNAQASREMLGALDETLYAYLGRSLGELYWEFARERGVELQSAGVIRPADDMRVPFTLQEDLFGEDGLIETEFVGSSTSIELSSSLVPALTNVPPLSSRAVVVNVDPATPDLAFTFNRGDWLTDDRGNSVAIKVYGEGDDGVELGGNASSVVLNPTAKSGVQAAVKQMGRVVVLISNLNLDAANSIYVNATRPSPSAQ